VQLDTSQQYNMAALFASVLNQYKIYMNNLSNSPHGSSGHSLVALHALLMEMLSDIMQTEPVLTPTSNFSVTSRKHYVKYIYAGHFFHVICTSCIGHEILYDLK